MTPQMTKLLHYYRNAPNPQAMADKVLKAIAMLGPQWVGYPKSTFVFKRAQGMFNPAGGNRT